MSITASITHVTQYQYDRLVTLSPQIIRLRPAPHSRTRVISHSLKVSPANHFVNHQQDLYGNWLARFVFPEPVREFKIEVDLVADMSVYNPFDFFVEEAAKEFPFAYDADIAQDLSIYLRSEDAGPKLDAFMATVSRDATPTIDFLVALNSRLATEITYEIRMEAGVQTPDTTLTRAAGSCRDTTWLLVQVLRRLGLAARFVSGYLIQLKPDLKALDGPQGTDVDFTDLHAWAEVYLPGAGWIGLDPTSGLLAGESHIPLAATPHYRHAAPIAGMASAADVTFNFDMHVRRTAEHPRITKPFSDDAWAALNTLGRQVDARLAAGDVRLTMGGEPTFIAGTDRDAEEWNTAAVGPTKRHYADQLIRRLRDRFAPGGVLHYGQGKWYPGETLPRWTFSLYWRKDGEPIWSNPDLIAREDTESDVGPDKAESLLQAIAAHLAVPLENVLPAYEDPAEWIVKEGNLPANVTPENPKLKDPEERARIARVFERGLTTPAGYVLPIQRWQSKAESRWLSEVWALRRGKVFLVAGDSPVGYRLPLGALPHEAESATFFVTPQDPTEPRAPLPKAEALRRPQAIASRTDAPAGQIRVEQSLSELDGRVRTALSVEPRDGRLCVFLPPVETLEDYLELIAAIEAAAGELSQPVQIEGYAPPNDPRVEVMRVAPDPGVLEVNIHPAASWDACVHTTETVYEEARQSRLGTDKFMLDGRHTGTGGGNHVVVGGATTNDSPFLRRPDLLKSLILFWQRHPSLSYLFSGTFVGPTSQAPRVDEGRQDGLYELEIALDQIWPPGEGQTPPPWLTDRLLRNALIDVTGNTHRTEICIDKLYSPDGPTGRLGLVEFRAFEMPPHARMALAQTLLVRALVAWVWTHPVTDPLIDHGPDLKDKYLLGDVLWDDFCILLKRLSDGIELNFDPEWFRAQFEFRFPLLGAFEAEGVQVELRSALEPWHVLGEEGTTSGTTRFVDSSLNRLQLKVTGGRDDLLLTCNTHEVPLMRLGQSHVGGVRFRTWLPVSCLHPTIPATPKLTFDLVSLRQNRAVGGATYWATHPGGRAFETRPVNALEAQSRVESRFDPGGHTPGEMRVTRASGTGVTLDLRQYS